MGAQERQLRRYVRRNLVSVRGPGTLVPMSKPQGSNAGRGERPSGAQAPDAPPVTHADIAERFAGDLAFQAMLAERWEALEERVRSQA